VDVRGDVVSAEEIAAWSSAGGCEKLLYT